MKSPILTVVLTLSILLNAAGIVFFVLYLYEHGHYKSARKQKAALERNLSVIQSGRVLEQASSSEIVSRRNFVSRFDGAMDSFAFQAPQFTPGALDYVLVVYLHGMGSNFMEPFVKPANETIASIISRENPRAGILSCNYRQESSWGNDAAVEDISQNIREILQEYPFKKLVIMGTSMGGCVALNYAATCPEDIKSRIAGVVSMESSGDLTGVFNKSRSQAIKPAMIVAFGGSPEQMGQIYQRKSFLSNVDSLPRDTRVYILSAQSDTVVPPEMQKAVIDALQKRSIANHLDEMAGQHDAPAAMYYARGMRFVLGENKL